MANIIPRIGQELIQECERVVHKTFPACVAFHKPSLIQQLKSHTLEASLTNALLCCASRYVAELLCSNLLPSRLGNFRPSGIRLVRSLNFRDRPMLTPYLRNYDWTRGDFTPSGEQPRIRDAPSRGLASPDSRRLGPPGGRRPSLT